MENFSLLLKDHKMDFLPGLSSRQAADIYKSFKLSKAVSKSLREPGISSEIFLKGLLQEGFYEDAISFLAHGLSKQAAIKWADICIRKTLSKEEAITFSYILGLIRQWLDAPKEETRSTLGEDETIQHPVDWLRMAIFWSGPSLSLHKDIVIAPAQTLTAEAVIAAIILAAVQADPKMAIPHYQDFIQLGAQEALKPATQKGSQ